MGHKAGRVKRVASGLGLKQRVRVSLAREEEVVMDRTVLKSTISAKYNNIEMDRKSVTGFVYGRLLSKEICKYIVIL